MRCAACGYPLQQMATAPYPCSHPMVTHYNVEGEFGMLISNNTGDSAALPPAQPDAPVEPQEVKPRPVEVRPANIKRRK